MPLISISEFKVYLGITDDQLWVSGLRLFVNTGPTTATVEVKTSSLEIVTTGGATPGTYTWDLTAAVLDTLTELVLSLNASPAGITAEALTVGAADSNDLVVKAATSCLGESNAQTLQIVDNYRLNLLIDFISDEVERFCDLEFEAATYSERYDGNGETMLVLNQRPVNTVTRLELAPVTVLQVTNESTTATRAFVRVDAATLTLTVETGAVQDVDILTLSGYATLTLLEAAINALSAKGWSAEAVAGYVDFSPTDLAVTESLYCLDAAASIDMFTEGRVDYTLYPERGWIYLSTGFTKGHRNVLVEYTAGYANIPGALKRATLRILSVVYYRAQSDPTLSSERLGDYSWAKRGELSENSLIDLMEEELALFRKYDVGVVL